MSPKGKGGGKTPERVVSMLNDAVSKSSQISIARSAGIPLSSIQKFLKGTSEPTQATFEKLAAYFNLSVWELRGFHPAIQEDGSLNFNKAMPYAVCARCGNELKPDDQGKEGWDGGPERFWPCETCCKK